MIENFDDLRDAIRADVEKAMDEEYQAACAHIKARIEAVFMQWTDREVAICDELAKSMGVNVMGFTIRRNYDGTKVDYSVNLMFGERTKNDTAN